MTSINTLDPIPSAATFGFPDSSVVSVVRFVFQRVYGLPATNDLFTYYHLYLHVKKSDVTGYGYIELKPVAESINMISSNNKPISLEMIGGEQTMYDIHLEKECTRGYEYTATGMTVQDVKVAIQTFDAAMQACEGLRRKPWYLYIQSKDQLHVRG